MAGRSFKLEEYDTVDSRISKFWEAFPEGRIIPSLVSDPNALDEVVFRVDVYLTRDDKMPAASGHASETRGKSASDMANFGSHVENAETSAIGRALANLNFKAKKESHRASREEMEKAERWQGNSQVERPVQSVTVAGPGKSPPKAQEAVLGASRANRGATYQEDASSTFQAELHKAAHDFYDLAAEFGIVDIEEWAPAERGAWLRTLMGKDPDEKLPNTPAKYWQAGAGLRAYREVYRRKHKTGDINTDDVRATVKRLWGHDAELLTITGKMWEKLAEVLKGV